MMEIRKADSGDYQVINSLAKSIWNVAYATILSKDQIKYMLHEMYSREAITEQIAIKGHKFLLLSLGGKDIGFASYELNYRSAVTKVHKLYVLPEIQRKGAGKILLNFIERQAKNNNNEAVQLNVNRYNPAVNFYLAMGFSKIKEEDIEIGNGYLMEDYIMQKML